MKYEYVKDYLWGVDLEGIDKQSLVQACLDVERFLKKNLPAKRLGVYGTFTTANFAHYNLLSWPSSQLGLLFDKMRDAIHPFLLNDSYTIQCWLNVYRSGEKIDWHTHWPDGLKVFHGFYCLQTNEMPSYTDYIVPKLDSKVRVDSHDGLLVFGRSDGDSHCSSLWEGSNPRITIAFDIIPIGAHSQLAKGNGFRLNHFIPFKSITS